jgi:hypothetical protein
LKRVCQCIGCSALRDVVARVRNKTRRITEVDRVVSDVCVETRARRISVAGIANSLCCLNSLAANLPGAPTSFAGKLP